VIQVPRGTRLIGEGAIPLTKGSSLADPPKKLPGYAKEALKWTAENVDRFWNHPDKKAHANELTFIYVRGIKRDRFRNVRAGFQIGGKLEASWFKDLNWLPDDTLECLVCEERAQTILDFLQRMGKPATREYALWEPELSSSPKFLNALKARLTRRLVELPARAVGVKYHLRARLAAVNKALLERAASAAARAK
jgi:hypothetical protein